MNKFLSSIIILIVFVSTVAVGLIKPVLHKQVMVVDSKYAFVDEVKKEPPVQKIEKKVQPKLVQKVEQKPVQKIQQSRKSETKKVVEQKKEPKKEKPVSVQQPKKEEVKLKEELKIEEKITPEEKVEEQAFVVKEPEPAKIKELTEEEEIIAWNKWRSDLQNQIMKDTNIMAPIGVSFKFSFTVDKFGNLSNVKVWSETPSYTDMAIGAMKPVIMSYQRTPILVFPEGTRRVITNVAGGFVMSQETGYSSPSDYSDYERVIR